jgi:hypothetical protein
MSNKRWSADHGLLATDTLASLVDTLALITRRISFLKGGRAEFRRNNRVCVLSSVSLSVDADFLKRVRR